MLKISVPEDHPIIQMASKYGWDISIVASKPEIPLSDFVKTADDDEDDDEK